MPHHGEEPPVSGNRGSGTIFFSYCNMKCAYCQNYQISQEFEGTEYGTSELADSMIKLQNLRCHNINFVSPTIWIPQIVKALSAARKKGLSVPTVFNTGGYDNPKIIKMLDGIIDIYMPDMRYSNNNMAIKYSMVEEYVRYNRQSVKEMYRQVGGLKLDAAGVAVRGLLVRLLVLPENIGGLKKTLDFIKNELSTDVYLSIMAQYHPAYRAFEYQKLSRMIKAKEYLEIVNYAEKLGFSSGWTQDYISLNSQKDLFIPDFKDKKVFKYYKK
jgi:putative pyruvate formate lyase activating enzyme